MLWGSGAIAQPAVETVESQGGVNLDSEFLKHLVGVTRDEPRRSSDKAWTSRKSRMRPRRPSHGGNRASQSHFQKYGVNPTVETEEERTSTFSADVDTESYDLARSQLLRGVFPDPSSIRVEHFVNSFEQPQALPEHEGFSIETEVFPSPHREGFHVLRIEAKAPRVIPAPARPSDVVFVVDVSPSMDDDLRLGRVKRGLRMAAHQLGPDDRIAIIAYGRVASIALPLTTAANKEDILAAIDALRAGGATYLETALGAAYKLVAASRRDARTHLVLCTDSAGVWRVGSEENLLRLVQREATGNHVMLSTAGFNVDGEDALMESLSRAGKGTSRAINSLNDARQAMVGALNPEAGAVANDPQLHVEFDPSVVARYRLIGHETRPGDELWNTNQDSEPLQVAAGHTVTALYEVRLSRQSADLGTVRIRYTDPSSSALTNPKPRFDGALGYTWRNRPERVAEPRLVEQRIPASVVRRALAAAAPSSQVPFLAAAFAEKLRGSYWSRAVSWSGLHQLWLSLPETVRARGEVADLGALIRRAQSLHGRPTTGSGPGLAP